MVHVRRKFPMEEIPLAKQQHANSRDKRGEEGKKREKEKEEMEKGVGKGRDGKGRKWCECDGLDESIIDVRGMNE